MEELELTWNRLFRMWWLVVWRGAVGGGALGAAFGFVAGFVLALAGLAQYITVVSTALGYLAGLIWAVFVLRMMLRKNYGDFKVALIKVPPERWT